MGNRSSRDWSAHPKFLNCIFWQFFIYFIQLRNASDSYCLLVVEFLIVFVS